MVRATSGPKKRRSEENPTSVDVVRMDDPSAAQTPVGPQISTSLASVALVRVRRNVLEKMSSAEAFPKSRSPLLSALRTLLRFCGRLAVSTTRHDEEGRGRTSLTRNSALHCGQRTVVNKEVSFSAASCRNEVKKKPMWDAPGSRSPLVCCWDEIHVKRHNSWAMSVQLHGWTKRV